MTLADQLREQLTHGHSIDHAVLADERWTDEPLHPAAVLIAVTDRENPGVILTRRASHLRKHAGQVAFPGGRVDPDDADVVAAALREAQEEIALDPRQVRIVGTSDRYKTFTGFDIIPVLAVIPPDLPLTPHEHEVEALFEVPLDFLLSPANRERKAIDFAGGIRHYYEIIWGDHRIWGVTAAIIANLSKRLGYDDLPA
ncbi:CoA pyrophosphatase [Sphingobium subterraneum]|uniref:8-oxo-dGTP pyrophosphatase MutT (NUDIX family) n=1 Tax=Sphingobium subterraneum TaxID=627688 RepID=A0A841IWB4_9SPHN|nr:CoA pyrophosphatase [Sphingobium subterraneum]MBB6123219.1 8-oxo-dGTP pyrophosphatase MutT (NUDIX family) [Sphingobium subterraneum]